MTTITKTTFMIHITSHIHPLLMIITYHKWIRMMIIHCSQSSQYISQKEQFNGCQKYWFGHQMGTVNFRSCHFLPHFLPYQTEPTHSPNSVFVISRAPFPMKLTTGSRTWLPWQKVYTLIYEGWTLTRDPIRENVLFAAERSLSISKGQRAHSSFFWHS